MLREPDFTYTIRDLTSRWRRGITKRILHELKAANARTCAYVVRDGEKILYIGMTRLYVFNRIQGHKSDNSVLGRFIKEKHPASGDWKVDVYSTNLDATEAYREESRLCHLLKPALNERYKGKMK